MPGHAPVGLWRYQANQSTRAPEAFTTFAIFTRSARSSALNASGLSAFGSIPCFASRSRITGSLSRVPTATLILSSVEPGIEFVARHPGLRDARQLGQELRALRRGHPEHAHARVLDEAERTDVGRDHRVRAARYDFVHRLVGRLVGHVHHVDAGETRKVRHRKMRGGAAAG